MRWTKMGTMMDRSTMIEWIDAFYQDGAIWMPHKRSPHLIMLSNMTTDLSTGDESPWHGPDSPETMNALFLEIPYEGS